MIYYSESDLKALRARELKAILLERGVNAQDCLEKSDFVALVLKTNPSKSEPVGEKKKGEPQDRDEPVGEEAKKEPQDRDPQEGMQVSVKNTTGQTIATLDCHSSDSIQSIKQKIQDTKGISLSLQHLLLDGNELCDDRTLTSYDVQDKSSLLLMLDPAQKVLLGDHQQLEEWVDEVKQHTLHLAMAKKAGKEADEIDSYGALGHAFFGLDQPELAMVCYEKLLASKQEEGDKKMIARLENHLGTCHWCLKQPDKALERVNKALAVAVEIGDELEEKIARHHLLSFSEATS